MGKQNMVCSYKWNVTQKKEWNTDTCYSVGNLENIMLMKETRCKRLHIVWFHLFEISRIGRSKETEEVVDRDRGAKMSEQWLLVSFGVMEMFQNSIVVMVVQLSEYTKAHQIVHFKRMNLWYLNYISTKTKSQPCIFTSVFCPGQVKNFFFYFDCAGSSVWHLVFCCCGAWAQ